MTRRQQQPGSKDRPLDQRRNQRNRSPVAQQGQGQQAGMLGPQTGMDLQLGLGQQQQQKLDVVTGRQDLRS
jgi:hypothetical protein